MERVLRAGRSTTSDCFSAMRQRGQSSDDGRLRLRALHNRHARFAAPVCPVHRTGRFGSDSPVERSARASDRGACERYGSELRGGYIVGATSFRASASKVGAQHRLRRPGCPCSAIAALCRTPARLGRALRCLRRFCVDIFRAHRAPSLHSGFSHARWRCQGRFRLLERPLR